MRCFSDGCFSLLYRSGRSYVTPWATAPPRIRVSICWLASSSKSRRTVAADTPRAFAASSTCNWPAAASVLRLEQDGQSLYPKLAGIIESSPELRRRVRVEIFRRFGYFPTESSEHSAEYVPWFIRHDAQIEQFRIFVGDYLERSEKNLRELESLQRDLAGEAPLDLAPTHELASLFIHSLETGTERELHVNIRNGGLIASLRTNAASRCHAPSGRAGPGRWPWGRCRRSSPR